MHEVLRARSIDTIFATRPLSFGIEPTMNRYCYSINNGTNYSIYAGGSGGESDHLVAESDYAGVTMLDSDNIIYTGGDGRLYVTDFNGINSFPFWGALDPQD